MAPTRILFGLLAIALVPSAAAWGPFDVEVSAHASADASGAMGAAEGAKATATGALGEARASATGLVDQTRATATSKLSELEARTDALRGELEATANGALADVEAHASASADAAPDFTAMALAKVQSAIDGLRAFATQIAVILHTSTDVSVG